MSATATGGGDRHIGPVFGRSFEILSRNLVTFFDITAIVFSAAAGLRLGIPGHADSVQRLRRETRRDRRGAAEGPRAIPACVLEGTGPYEAVSRSAFLTQGRRWKVFGIALVIEIVSVIAAMALTAGLAFIIGDTGAVVGSYTLDVAVFSFQGVGVAVLYHDLRVAKEDVDVERIAAVFE
jgi:hypothetical protein